MPRYDVMVCVTVEAKNYAQAEDRARLLATQVNSDGRLFDMYAEVAEHDMHAIDGTRVFGLHNENEPLPED